MAKYEDDPRASFMKITRRYCKTFSGPFIPQEAQDATTWDPSADIYETESAFIVRMEAGGMHKNDFEIKLVDDVLHIRGCRMENEPRCKTCIQQMELNYGPFDKVIRNVPPVDLDGIQATYTDGILVIVLPKANIEKKKIDIG